jgi:hypothetical protein
MLVSMLVDAWNFACGWASLLLWFLCGDESEPNNP